MAQRINVILVDDTDGSEAAETVAFGLDGTRYEIDLSSVHALELRGKLERYIKVARKAGGAGSRPARARRTSGSDARNKEIRSWAQGKGLDVNARGRIPASVTEQYETETGN